MPNLPLVVTVLCWALNFSALKVVYQSVSASAVALVRAVITWVALWLFCVVRKERPTYPRDHRWRILLQGFLSMGVYMVVFLEGMKTAPASQAAIVMATAPILTSLFSALVKQDTLDWRLIVGSSIAFVGVLLVVASGSGADRGELFGTLLIFLAACIWAVSVIVMRPVLEARTPYQALTLSMPAAFVALIPYGLSASLHTDWTQVDGRTWLFFGHVAILSGGLAFITFYEGIRQIGAARATLYQYFVPPFAAFFAWWVLGNPLRPLQGVGLVVVLAGVALGSARHQQTKPVPVEV